MGAGIRADRRSNSWRYSVGWQVPTRLRLTLQCDNTEDDGSAQADQKGTREGLGFIFRPTSVAAPATVSVERFANTPLGNWEGGEAQGHAKPGDLPSKRVTRPLDGVIPAGRVISVNAVAPPPSGGGRWVGAICRFPAAALRSRNA